MALSAEATVDGRTLQQFLAVTREELTASMDNEKLMEAAASDGKHFVAWMAQTHWPHFSEQVAEHVCGFLQENSVNVFAGAWTKYAELRKYAKQTLDDPKSTVDVALADHEFTYELKPAVDILLDGMKVAHIAFTIAITCTVTALELSLRMGCVYQVRSGKCDCKAEIQCADNVVWSRALAGVNLPGELRLDKPISLA